MVKIKQISEEVPKEKRKLSFKEKSEFDQIEKDLERLEEEKMKWTNVLSDAASSTEHGFL